MKNYDEARDDVKNEKKQQDAYDIFLYLLKIFKSSLLHLNSVDKC